MKIINKLVLGIVLISLGSCNQQQETKEAPLASILVSGSYKPAVFENDKRIEKIKEITPEIHELFTKYRKKKNIPGIVYGIVVDDELVIASATGLINLENEKTATIKSEFRIASMTKSFTAMAILKLRDEGKLSLCDPVYKYIPEMSELKYLTNDASVIDIEDLLTMTAGFPEDNPWGDRQLEESDQMLMDLLKKGVSFSNPTAYDFEYSNTSYALLGNIISRISGKPFQEYISENILLPLKMEHTYWEYDSVPKNQLVNGYRWENGQWKLEPILHDGVYGAVGGLITNIEDFSKYVSFHLSAWPPRSDSDVGPIKRSSLREMQTPQFSKLHANATYFNGEPCAKISGYGYGLSTTSNCKELKWVSHGGALPGFGSFYLFFPEYGVGVMAFCNLTYTYPWPNKEFGKLLFKTIDKIEPRHLPISTILNDRKDQVVELIQNWDSDIEKKILAENFYLDKSRKNRTAEIQEVLDKAGTIINIQELKPINQLRGSFKIKAENGFIDVFFTLTPEKYPKVQKLDVSFQQNETSN